MDSPLLFDMLKNAGDAYNKNCLETQKGQTKLCLDCRDCGVQFFVKKGNTLTIAFRGTDSLKDWMTDFRFLKKCVPYGNTGSKIKVHRGFLESYKNSCVRETILYIMNRGIRKVAVTGHSYGAALALLCAVDLQYHYPQTEYEVVVFGCPRVGNRAFCESFDRRLPGTVRVENGNDIVTKIPFRFLGYRHVGTAVPVGKKRRFLCCSVKEHFLNHYYDSLVSTCIVF